MPTARRTPIYCTYLEYEPEWKVWLARATAQLGYAHCQEDPNKAYIQNIPGVRARVEGVVGVGNCPAGLCPLPGRPRPTL